MTAIRTLEFWSLSDVVKEVIWPDPILRPFFLKSGLLNKSSFPYWLCLSEVINADHVTTDYSDFYKCELAAECPNHNYDREGGAMVVTLRLQDTISFNVVTTSNHCCMGGRKSRPIHTDDQYSVILYLHPTPSSSSQAKNITLKKKHYY